MVSVDFFWVVSRSAVRQCGPTPYGLASLKADPSTPSQSLTSRLTVSQSPPTQPPAPRRARLRWPAASKKRVGQGAAVVGQARASAPRQNTEQNRQPAAARADGMTQWGMGRLFSFQSQTGLTEIDRSGRSTQHAKDTFDRCKNKKTTKHKQIQAKKRNKNKRQNKNKPKIQLE